MGRLHPIFLSGRESIYPLLHKAREQWAIQAHERDCGWFVYGSPSYVLRTTYKKYTNLFFKK